MALRLGPKNQPWLEGTFRVIAIVAVTYVAAVMLVFIRGEGSAAAYLTMPAAIPIFMMLDWAAGIAPEAWRHSWLANAAAVGASGVINGIVAYGVARLVVARW
jgi:hypothetical protein